MDLDLTEHYHANYWPLTREVSGRGNARTLSDIIHHPGAFFEFASNLAHEGIFELVSGFNVVASDIYPIRQVFNNSITPGTKLSNQPLRYASVTANLRWFALRPCELISVGNLVQDDHFICEHSLPRLHKLTSIVTRHGGIRDYFSVYEEYMEEGKREEVNLKLTAWDWAIVAKRKTPKRTLVNLLDALQESVKQL